MDVHARRDTSQKWRWWAALAIAWSVMTAAAWPYLLDDTYIHLRYAWNLLVHGHYAFNAAEPSAGTSAPVFARALAWIGSFVAREDWPTMAKIIGVAASGGALVVFGALAWPASSRARTWWLVTALLLFVVPTSIRWLQDGMETPWLVLGALACGWAVDRWGEQGSAPDRIVTLGIVAALPAMLRVDAAPITFACLLAARALDRRGWWWSVAIAAALVLGCWLAVWSSLGTLVPDAAIAKAQGFSLAWPLDLAASIATVSPWWALGTVLLVVRILMQPRWRMLALCGLVPLVAMAAAGWLRGQQIPGARYAMPPLAFAWAIVLVLERRTRWLETGIALARGRRIAIAATLLATIHAVVTWPAVRVLLQGQRIDMPVALLVPGTRVLHHDVGLASWIAPIVTFDIAGLVNGRETAEMPASQRPCALAKRHGPAQYLILRDESPRTLLPELPGTIDYGDGWIAITCEGLGRRVYAPTDHVVMVNQKLRDSPHWRVWAPIPGPAE